MPAPGALQEPFRLHLPQSNRRYHRGTRQPLVEIHAAYCAIDNSDYGA